MTITLRFPNRSQVVVNWSAVAADGTYMQSKRSDGGLRRRGAVAVAIVAAAVAAVSLGALLVVTSGARTVAVTSGALEWSNAVSAASAATRAANSQALVFAVDFDLGVASAEARSVALGEARSNLAKLDAVASTPPPQAKHGTVMAAVRNLQVAALDTITALESGDLREADRLHSDVFARAYEEATTALSVQQASFAAAVQSADGVAARFEAITQILITLLIPAVAILGYRAYVARQQKERKYRFEARLSAEQEYSRAKDEFLNGISHELRTPLTSIYGLSEHLVEQGLADVVEAEKLIELIHNDSVELFRMVEDLLVAARIDAGAITVEADSVDIGSVFESAAASGAFSKGDVTVTGDATVLGDDRFLTHVARNLLSNAETHGGETVRVIIEERATDVKVAVEDDGPGVREDRIDALFKPFVHDGAEVLLVGTFGLGLAVSRLLVNAMGGTIGYSYTAGWSSFTLLLPRADAVLDGLKAAAPADPFAVGHEYASPAEPPDRVATG
jgi:signal transduction histidine kinase